MGAAQAQSNVQLCRYLVGMYAGSMKLAGNERRAAK